MLDIKFILDDARRVKDNLKKRKKADLIWMVDELILNNEEWKKLKKDVDELRRQRNNLSKEINVAKKGKKPVDNLVKQAGEIPLKIKDAEERILLLEEEMGKKLTRIPNMLHDDVPEGENEKDNVEKKKVGKPIKPSFELKSHEEIAENLCIADFDAGREVAGKGFNYITGKLARLDLALQRYGVDFLLSKGFTLVVPPLMLNRETVGGAVDLEAFEEVIYKIENEDLHLIGTAEHSLVTFLKNKTLDKKNLPLKLCAVTPCFRKEIGGHGVDMKGLFRMHQFNKVEQVVFTTPENSFKMLEELQTLTEEFFKNLEIPFRVIEICAGDLGGKFARQYDIEAWFPRQQAYREVTSAGNCTDYQARRLKIKYQDKDERKYVHIVNNTMVATSRAMVAILENFQQKDGSIKIPKALRKYTGFAIIQ